MTAEWLLEHLDEVIIADVRWAMSGPRGRERYAEGHIPGAYFVDLDADLSAAGAPGGRHPLPSANTFAAMLSRIGYDGSRRIVAYDDRHGAVAARLWWMIRYFGLEDGAVLDGGLDAWTAAGGELTPEVPAAVDTPHPTLTRRSELVASAEDVAHRPDDLLLLDARSEARYRGDEEPIDPRAGHIPGAVSAFWQGNLDGETMASEATLRRRYQDLGLGEGPVTAYCGSGVTACHDLLALSLIGRDDARLYVGSWSDWSSDPQRPCATGDEPQPQPER